MIYFISSGGKLKIGRSKNPFQRVKTIQTANAEECRVLLAIDLDNAEAVEAILHERLSYARREGEWFEVTFERAFNELIEARPQMVFRGQKELGLLSPQQPTLEECADEFRGWWSTIINPTWVETEMMSIPYLWGNYRQEFLEWKATQSRK